MIVIAVLLGILNLVLWSWVIVLTVREKKENGTVPEQDDFFENDNFEKNEDVDMGINFDDIDLSL